MRLIDADKLQEEHIKNYGKRLLLIDVAPTVEPTFGIFKQMLCSECDKRPKGEWIEVDRSEITHNMAGEVLTFYRCSKCDRTLSIYPSMLTDFPFCHCGADMRGDDEVQYIQENDL